jgi:hypothetical protein
LPFGVFSPPEANERTTGSQQSQRNRDGGRVAGTAGKLSRGVCRCFGGLDESPFGLAFAFLPLRLGVRRSLDIVDDLVVDFLAAGQQQVLAFGKTLAGGQE